jgi:hypothetical protein
MEERMRATTTGLFVGLFLGLALIIGGFGDMLVVGFAGAIGYVVMKVVEGEIDLTQYLGGQRQSRPSEPSSRRRV